MISCKFQHVGTSKHLGYHKYACIRCGIEAHSPYGSESVHGECFGWPTIGEPGYWLVLILAAVGITQGRYVWCKRLLGLAPTCGCAKRAEALNAIGGRLAGK